MALHAQGHRAASAGRPADAAKLLRHALRTLPLTSGDVEVTAARVRILITLSYAEAETGSAADGLAHLGTAHDLVGLLPASARQATWRGVVKGQQALILHRIGRATEAIALFDETVAYLENATEADPAVLVTALVNRAISNIGFGRPVPAEQDMWRAVELADALDLPLMKAKARNNLGDIAQLTGDIPGSLRHYEDADHALRALAPDLVPRLRIDQARSMLAAGLAAEAAEHLDEALEVLRKHRVGQDLAEAELTRAAAALLQGDFTKAHELAGQAQRRFVRRGSASWSQVAALTKMRAEASVVLAGGTSRTATPGRAARLAERLDAVGLTDEAAVATMLAVRMALRHGTPEVARSLVGRVPEPGPNTPADHRMLLRLCRAELAVADGTPREALDQARDGLAELGRIRDRMGGLDLLCGTAVHGRELGELAVRLVLDTDGDARETFDWLERTRAQVYRYEPLPAIDNPVLARRVAESRSLSRGLQQARLEGRPVAELETRLDALRREVSRLGWHTSVWGRPRPVSGLADVAPRLGERAMVSFVVNDDVMSAVVVVDGEARLTRLGSTNAVHEIAKQLQADLDVLAPDHLPDALVDAVTASATRRAALLDRWLVEPLAPMIGDRPLVIVPTGVLYAVPWGTLPSLHGRPVVVAPSATAWLIAQDGAARASASSVVLVGGPDLREGVGEVRGLLAAYPGAVLLDEADATVGNVLAALDGARLAHVAAHGTHARDNALFSRLELFDGPMFAHETARLRKPPEQVVLAACELALSNIRPGDEALGFAGALLAGGSHTVVSAVNKVGDRASAVTMDAFHKLLAEGKPTARALAEATAVDPLRRPFVCFGAGA